MIETKNAMAMEGTHLRFAYDLADRLSIKDKAAYFSGSVYPDSRYPTGIDRMLTHNEDLLTLDLRKSDFELGIATHIICDQLQAERIRPLVTQWEPGTKDWWMRLTAIKCLQDLEDVKHFPLKEAIGHLTHTEAYNGEDVSKIEQYNRSIQQLYQQDVLLDDYASFWDSLLGDTETCERVRVLAHELKEDQNLCQQVNGFYKEMLAEFEEGWQKDPVNVTKFIQ